MNEDTEARLVARDGSETLGQCTQGCGQKESDSLFYEVSINKPGRRTVGSGTFRFLYSFHVISYQWRIQDSHKGEANICPRNPISTPLESSSRYFPSVVNNEATLHPP